jgi:hypothetical protein
MFKQVQKSMTDEMIPSTSLKLAVVRQDTRPPTAMKQDEG